MNKKQHARAADRALDGYHAALNRLAVATRRQRGTADSKIALGAAREMLANRALAKAFDSLAKLHLFKADDMSADADRAEDARASAREHAQAAEDAQAAQQYHEAREIDHGKSGDMPIARAHARLAEGGAAIATSEATLADAFRALARSR